MLQNNMRIFLWKLLISFRKSPWSKRPSILLRGPCGPYSILIRAPCDPCHMKQNKSAYGPRTVKSYFVYYECYSKNVQNLWTCQKWHLLIGRYIDFLLTYYLNNFVNWFLYLVGQICITGVSWKCLKLWF